MNNTIDHVINQLKSDLPSVFALTKIDFLTGGAINHRTIHNKRSLQEIPEDCFLKQGSRKTLVIRDPFLDWWQTQLSPCETK